MAVTSMANSSIRDFQKSNRFAGPITPYRCTYVIVAGGAGGGGSAGDGAANSGGGAGGYRSSVPGENSGGGASAENPLFLNPGIYSVMVGAGGAGGAATNYTKGVSGAASEFAGVFSVGGGGGGGGQRRRRRRRRGAGGGGLAPRSWPSKDDCCVDAAPARFGCYVCVGGAGGSERDGLRAGRGS